jgi:hypothetical protein
MVRTCFLFLAVVAATDAQRSARPVPKNLTRASDGNSTVVWVAYNGSNCYTSEGATDLESPEGTSCGQMDVVGCEEMCLTTKNCTAITFDNYYGWCYRRADVVIEECSSDDQFTTFVMKLRDDDDHRDDDNDGNDDDKGNDDDNDDNDDDDDDDDDDGAVFCPTGDDFLFSDDSEYGHVDPMKCGWTISGSGWVGGRTSYNLLGGFVEWTSDTSGTQDGVNTNVRFPQYPTPERDPS